MSGTPDPVRARLIAMAGGREVSALATVSLEPRGLQLASERGRVLLVPGAVAGVTREREEAVLWLERGDTVRLGSVPGLDALLAAFDRRARAVPELTRSLRALGTRRAAAVPEHDRFFAPLLAACRAAAAGPSPDAALEAFAAAPLASAMSAELAGIARDRYPGEPAEQRALDAELSEAAEPLRASLDALGARQGELAAAGAEESYRRWRRWLAALRAVAQAADECWSSIAGILEPDRRSARRGRRARPRRAEGEP